LHPRLFTHPLVLRNPVVLEKIPLEELDLSFAVNARATLLLAKEFAAQAEDGGRIVFFTSGQYHGAMPEELPYTHTHDEPPGASHHHGAGGVHGPGSDVHH
jgi:NAD(P)-dependent dehydrogenase (short-subunit alcohol dehydrogenase family)